MDATIDTFRGLLVRKEQGMKEGWEFKYCEVDRVIDGDSLVLSIDTGFYHSAKVHVRLLGVDTPERTEDAEKWRLSREYVSNWLIEAKELSFFCTGPDKYGRRWLGVIRNHRGESLADVLIFSGHGVRYHGEKKV